MNEDGIVISWGTNRRLIATLLAGLLAGGAQAQENTDQGIGLYNYPGATGGVLRFPNLQIEDEVENGLGEAWIKQGAVIYKSGETKLQVFGQLNYVRDTEPNVWNNNYKFTFGATASTRINKLELLLTLKHEYYQELQTDKTLQATRLQFDYYYYDEWVSPNPPAKDEFGYLKTSLKAYGNAVYPASLEEGDNNFGIFPGGELARHYQLPNTELRFVPFVDLAMGWDRDENDYNHYIRPAVGAKLVYPIYWGEIFAGVKYEAEWRPINDSFDAGPQLFIGWYKGWGN